MPLSSKNTYVGFGLGAIQSGLFLYEAYQSGNFDRLIVAEVIPEIVSNVRNYGGRLSLNIAYEDRIEKSTIEGIDIRNPNDPSDREFLICAIAEAKEMGTAVPSVDFYSNDKPGSIDRLLTQGLILKNKREYPPAIVYTAENHNSAAEILKSNIAWEANKKNDDQFFRKVQILNTVIGKMSQIITDTDEIKKRNLIPITPGINRAVLVESFNKILISKIKSQNSFQRGINVFQEKNDLLPFEEAKLFGHNAVHAILGYLGLEMGIKSMPEFREYTWFLHFAKSIFIDEIGKALTKKYNGIDLLFSNEGFSNYAEDLLERMTNTLLKDTVARVTRDVNRKLGWDDRIIGGMRCCLSNDINPVYFAFGAISAIASGCDGSTKMILTELEKWKETWSQSSNSSEELTLVIEKLNATVKGYRKWVLDGYCNPVKVI